MPLPVAYRPKVGRDLAAGFDYYEGQAQGLGEQFLSAVNAAFDALARYPEMFSRVHGDVRRALVTRFPYAVFYRVESKRCSQCCIPRVMQSSGRSREGVRDDY